MKGVSTREAAKKLGVHILTLQRHVTRKTVKAPPLQKIGGVSIRLWTARDIEKARKVLAGIRPGRKKRKLTKRDAPVRLSTDTPLTT